MRIRDYIALLVVIYAGVIAWIDPTYRDKFFSIAGAVITGYFALALPRQN